MEHQSCEIEVNGRRLYVDVMITDGKRRVSGIWEKGGEDPLQFFNSACDDVPWNYEQSSGWPGDEVSRTKLRDEVIGKVRDALGQDVVFEIKSRARTW